MRKALPTFWLELECTGQNYWLTKPQWDGFTITTKSSSREDKGCWICKRIISTADSALANLPYHHLPTYEHCLCFCYCHPEPTKPPAQSHDQDSSFWHGIINWTSLLGYPISNSHSVCLKLNSTSFPTSSCEPILSIMINKTWPLSL